MCIKTPPTEHSKSEQATAAMLLPASQPVGCLCMSPPSGASVHRQSTPHRRWLTIRISSLSSPVPQGQRDSQLCGSLASQQRCHSYARLNLALASSFVITFVCTWECSGGHPSHSALTRPWAHPSSAASSVPPTPPRTPHIATQTHHTLVIIAQMVLPQVRTSPPYVPVPTHPVTSCTLPHQHTRYPAQALRGSTVEPPSPAMDYCGLLLPLLLLPLLLL